MEQSTAAAAARDWPSLERLAARYLKACARVLGDQELSSAYEDLAHARLNLDRPTEALQATNTCIQAYYANSGCHLLKVDALLKLHRPALAREALDVADRLLAHNLEQAENAVASATTEQERNLATAKKHNFEAQRRFAESERQRYFPDN